LLECSESDLKKKLFQRKYCLVNRQVMNVFDKEGVSFE
jgi:hypothetical protein